MKQIDINITTTHCQNLTECMDVICTLKWRSVRHIWIHISKWLIVTYIEQWDHDKSQFQKCTYSQESTSQKRAYLKWPNTQHSGDPGAGRGRKPLWRQTQRGGWVFPRCVVFWLVISEPCLCFVAADCADYQLVTWSRDQSLRLWRIDTQLQKVRNWPGGGGGGEGGGGGGGFKTIFFPRYFICPEQTLAHAHVFVVCPALHLDFLNWDRVSV